MLIIGRSPRVINTIAVTVQNDAVYDCLRWCSVNHRNRNRHNSYIESKLQLLHFDFVHCYELSIKSNFELNKILSSKLVCLYVCIKIKTYIKKSSVTFFSFIEKQNRKKPGMINRND